MSGNGEPAAYAAATAALTNPIPRMAAVALNDYNSPDIRQSLRRERAARRTATRSRWWFPLVGALLALAGCWGLLKTDQVVADQLIWPTAGAQFVEVGQRPADPDRTGDPMVVVVAGLNRKDGTGVAEALMPSLGAGHSRVFSLVYGSGISDRDILDKFDALIGQFQPEQVSFFGSSMGGDVVLQLAAHTQELRTGYVTTLLALPRSGAQRPTPAGSSATVVQAGQARRPDLGLQIVDTADSATEPQPAVAVDSPITDASTGTSTSTDTGGSTSSPESDPAPTHPAPTDAKQPTTTAPPRLGTIFLDCSPLGANDVRDSSRTKADMLTAVMEATGTEGGAAVRMAAEVVGQQQQWSAGRFPFLQVRSNDLFFKVNQVWQQKISSPGISTQLIKDQYGVIRRTDIGEIAESFVPGTRIVYFLPESRHDDRTVRVERVEETLRQLAADRDFDLRIVQIPAGHHASAESNSEAYRLAIDAVTNDPA